MEGLVEDMIDFNFWKGKKIFITGHTGFKGSWLCRILLNAGAKITGYSLSVEKNSMYDILNINNSINSVIDDIRNLESLKETFLKAEPEVVFHLAAQPIVKVSYVEPVNTYQTNVMGAVNILECIRIFGNLKSFVNVTTDKVYENKEWNWGYREVDRLGGSDPYANSKSCSELVTEGYKKSYFNIESITAISTARSGNVFGGGDFSVGRIIPDCVRAAIANESILIRNPYSIRPYQHVLECLSGYILLAQKQYENKNKYSGSYNFGPYEHNCLTTGELVDLFCTKWGENLNWEKENSNGLRESNLLKLDSSKARNVLGWYPCWDIETAIYKTVEWYKAWSNGKDVEREIQRQIESYFDIK